MRWIALAICAALVSTPAYTVAQPDRARPAGIDTIDASPQISVPDARSRAVPTGRAEAVESLLATPSGRQQVSEALPGTSDEDLDALSDVATDGTQVSSSDENLEEYMDVMNIDPVDWVAGVTFSPLRDAPTSTYVDDTWPVGALRVHGLGAWSELNLRDMLDIQSVPLIGPSRAKLHLDLPDADGAWMVILKLFIPDEVAEAYGLVAESPTFLQDLALSGVVKLEVEGPGAGGPGPRAVTPIALRDGSGYTAVVALEAPENPRATQIEGMRQVTHTVTMTLSPPAGYLLFGGMTIARL